MYRHERSCLCLWIVLVITQDQLDALLNPNDGCYLKRVDLVYDLLAKNHSNTKVPNTKHNVDNLRKNIFKKTLVLDVDNTLVYVRHFMDEMRVDDKVKFGDKDAIVTQLTYRLDLEFTSPEDKGKRKIVEDHIITTADQHIPQRADPYPNAMDTIALIHQADPISCKIKITNGELDKRKEEKDKEKEKEKETEKENDEIIEISFLKLSKELSMLEPVLNRQVLRLYIITMRTKKAQENLLGISIAQTAVNVGVLFFVKYIHTY